MSLTFRVGNDSFNLVRRWEAKQNGWLLRDNS
jgi:hypothetical protein